MVTETYTWEWEEAFDKFGFDDGDGMVHTYEVADFIQELGWECDYDGGIHNSYFVWLKKDGAKIECDGYENPRDYLPEDLVRELDTKF